MSRLTKFVAATCGPVALVASALATASPAHAAPTICNANTSWYTITSQSHSEQIDTGDYRVYRNQTGSPLRITTNLEVVASTSASTTTSSGTSISASVGVSVFNAELGLTSASSNEMQNGMSWTGGVTQDITIPAYKSYVQYAGQGVTKASMNRRTCNSTGTAISYTWVGTVLGPRYNVYTWADCAVSPLC